jgi:transposase
MIGIDPHKGSHTAVAVGAAGQALGKIRIRACPAQAGQLAAWAAGWPERTWAVEGARGLGRLLGQQLAAAGERVLGVQPKLAARVRLLHTGNTGKSDPSDALPVAVAALRSAANREVTADDHATVLKVWAKRHRDLSRAYTQVACRLHAVLCGLVPGGVPEEITAGRAEKILAQIRPAGPAGEARCELATELLADMRHLGGQRREVKKKLAAAVKATGTTVTSVSGAGPVIAATVIGDVVTVARFPARDHFAACNGTAPVEVSSGEKKIYRLSLRGNRRLNHAIHMAAITQISHAHSDGRACYERKIAGGKTHKEALRCLKRRISGAIYARLRADARAAGLGGQPGDLSSSRAAGSHPDTSSSGKPLPGPKQPTSQAHAAHANGATPRPRPARPAEPLDNSESKEDSIWTSSALMVIKMLTVQVWVFCAPWELVGSGGRYPRTGSVRLVDPQPVGAGNRYAAPTPLTATVFPGFRS